MAHTIVETPSFDLNIVVPDGTDSRADAAEKVAAIAQKLANRTQSMKLVTDVAAKKNVSNTFTAPNTFSVLTTMQTLHVNSTTEVAGNLWVDSSKDVLYMGTVVTVHKQISLARGAPNVSAAVDVNIRLQIANPVLENFAAINDGVWFVPIELPSGCKLVDAQFQYHGGPSDDAFDFNIMRQTITDWAADPAGGASYTGIGSGASSLAGLHTATCSLGNYTINNANETYYARIISNALADDGSIWGFRVGFTNYGLNNR